MIFFNRSLFNKEELAFSSAPSAFPYLGVFVSVTVEEIKRDCCLCLLGMGVCLSCFVGSFWSFLKMPIKHCICVKCPSDKAVFPKNCLFSLDGLMWDWCIVGPTTSLEGYWCFCKSKYAKKCNSWTRTNDSCYWQGHFCYANTHLPYQIPQSWCLEESDPLANDKYVSSVRKYYFKNLL